MTPRIVSGLTNRFTYASVGLLVAGTTATGLAASTSAHAATEDTERPITGAHTDNPIHVHAATVKALQAVARTATAGKRATVSAHREQLLRMHRVRRGETLSEIARTYLGSAKRYQEIFDLNRGRPQPGGGQLTHPNLIEPGWILELPGDPGIVRASTAPPSVGIHPCPDWLPGSDPCGQQPYQKRMPVHFELGTPVFLTAPGASNHASPARAGHPGTPSTARTTNRWAAPITTSYTISEDYGVANSRYAAGHHTGVDLAVPVGTPVHAISSGTVAFAGWGGSYGNLIKVRDSDGRYSLYAHLSRVDVSVGESVDAGRRIALSGASGNVTGPHLHFEIDTSLQYGSDIDPVNYLAAHGIHL